MNDLRSELVDRHWGYCSPQSTSRHCWTEMYDLCLFQQCCECGWAAGTSNNCEVMRVIVKTSESTAPARRVRRQTWKTDYYWGQPSEEGRGRYRVLTNWIDILKQLFYNFVLLYTNLVWYLVPRELHPTTHPARFGWLQLWRLSPPRGPECVEGQTVAPESRYSRFRRENESGSNCPRHQ